MITYLKILSLLITAVVGIWASWNDFKENKKKVKNTIFLYSSLLIILSALSFFIGDMEDSKQEVNQARKFSTLIDSTKQLLDSVKLEMKEQYEDLSTINQHLKKQNLQLAKQLQANQYLIDQQYIQSKDIQEKILLASNQAINKIDSSSSALIELTNRQAKAQIIAENIAEVSNNNLSSISNLNSEVKTVTAPLTNFKIEFMLRYTLNKPLVDESKLYQPRMIRLACPEYFNNIYYTGLYDDYNYPNDLSDPIYFYETSNINEIKKYFSKFQYIGFKLLNFGPTHTAYLGDSILDREEIKNMSNKISFTYSLEYKTPLFEESEPNTILQPVTITINSISSNPSNVRSLVEAFKNAALHIYFSKTGTPPSISMKNLWTPRKKLFNDISIKDIAIANDIKIVYGKDFEFYKSFLNTRFISGPTKGEVNREKGKNSEVASLYRDDIFLFIDNF